MRKIVDDTSPFHKAAPYRGPDDLQGLEPWAIYYELKEFPSSFDALVRRVFDTLAACSRIRRF